LCQDSEQNLRQTNFYSQETDHARAVRILSQTEIRDLFKILGNTRDQLLFALGIYSGLRIGEIIAIKQSQVFTKDGGTKNALEVTGHKTKNTVYSDIPIHPKLRERLLRYKNDALEGHVAGGAWLFPSDNSSSGHLERVRAHIILRDAFDRLRLEDASTHSMRRTCLTSMSRSGIPLRTIQEISGHASLSQLQEYLAVDPADKHKAINVLKY
jgi:integrase/recombinase XerD